MWNKRLWWLLGASMLAWSAHAQSRAPATAGAIGFVKTAKGEAFVNSGGQAVRAVEGTPLKVGEPGEPALEGSFAGLTKDGALQLRSADGTTRIIPAGEVRLAGGQ